jgi:hypothetical protein
MSPDGKTRSLNAGSAGLIADLQEREPLRRLRRAITLWTLSGAKKHFDDKAVPRWPVGRDFKREGQVVSLPEMSQWGPARRQQLRRWSARHRIKNLRQLL